jgi:hypothetical protein
MIVRMGRAQNAGRISPVDTPPDVRVTGALPTSLTTFVGRARELDQLQSLFRDGKRLVALVVMEVSVRPGWPWSWAQPSHTAPGTITYPDLTALCHITLPSMYEEHDAPEARVSAVCLEVSPLAPLARKLFSTWKIFTPYDQKVSAIKIVSALKRLSAPPGTGRTGQVGRQGPAAIHSKSTALCHIAVRSALKNLKDTPGVGECPS